MPRVSPAGWPLHLRHAWLTCLSAGCTRSAAHNPPGARHPQVPPLAHRCRLGALWHARAVLQSHHFPCHPSMLAAAHSAAASAGARQARAADSRATGAGTAILVAGVAGAVAVHYLLHILPAIHCGNHEVSLEKMSLLKGGCLKLAEHPECWRPSQSDEEQQERSAAVGGSSACLTAPAATNIKGSPTGCGCCRVFDSSAPAAVSLPLDNETRAQSDALGSQSHLESARIAKMQAWGRLPSHSSQNGSASEDRGFLPAAPVRGDGRRSAARQCIWALVYRLGTAPDLGSKPHLWG